MLRRWWYNNVKRHFWYHYLNWRYPSLPRVRPGYMTKEMQEWAEQQFQQADIAELFGAEMAARYDTQETRR